MPTEVPSHAIITGGSSGIGLALATRLARTGWRLTLVARNAERLARSQAALEAVGGTVTTRALDVADGERLARAVGEAIGSFGPPALAVACAGMVLPLTFNEQGPADHRRTMEVNYLGSVHLVRAVLPAMRAARRGRIVLLASGAGLIGFYGYTSYAPSKFAVRGFAEALRSELAPEGIGVSVVFPPDTDTPGFREEQRHRPAATAHIAASGRLLEADEVAAAVLRGIERRAFAITPGLSMTALGALHSLVGPWLHRLWFDPIVARHHVEKRALPTQLP